MAVKQQREKAAQEDEKYRCEVAHAEPKNRDRNPGQGGNGAENLYQAD